MKNGPSKQSCRVSWRRARDRPAAKPKSCKGMAGLLDEDDDVIKGGEGKDDIAADLSVIASAQKGEHYEMSW